jgi:hypothetical protein
MLTPNSVCNEARAQINAVSTLEILTVAGADGGIALPGERRRQKLREEVIVVRL